VRTALSASVTLLAVLTWSTTGHSAGAAADVSPVVHRFLTSNDRPLSGFVAARHLEASSRNGSIRGALDACTELAGDVFRYRIIHEEGSGQIRRHVLVAALEAEARMRQNGDVRRSSLDPINYMFADNREEPDGLTRVEVRALRQDVTLINGAIFVEPEGDLVRVEGVLAKRPSFWTRRVEVVRRYARIDGVRVPVSMESMADVLIFGRSSFTMTYDYQAINGTPLAPATAALRPRCGPEPVGE